MRRRLPWFLVDRGVAAKGVGDCGDHEWYNHDGVIARYYHCEVGERSWPVRSQDGDVSRG